MSTTTEESKLVARNFYEAYNSKDLHSSFDKYISKDLVNRAMGGAATRQFWLDSDIAALAAIPDLRSTILDQVAEENKVFTRWVFEGTHTGSFFGAPASGKPIRLEAVTIDVVKDGQIVEHDIVADFTPFMQQLQNS